MDDNMVINYNLSDWFDSEQNYLDGFQFIDLSDEIEEHSVVPGESADTPYRMSLMNLCTYIAERDRQTKINKFNFFIKQLRDFEKVLGEETVKKLPFPPNSKRTDFTLTNSFKIRVYAK